jgi:hypothetical protein
MDERCNVILYRMHYSWRLKCFFLILSSHLHVGPASFFLLQRLLPKLCIQFSYLPCLPLALETHHICFYHSKECIEGYELYFSALHSAASSCLFSVAPHCWPPSLCVLPIIETEHFTPTQKSINCSENISKVTSIDLMGKNPKFESCAAH